MNQSSYSDNARGLAQHSAAVARQSSQKAQALVAAHPGKVSIAIIVLSVLLLIFIITTVVYYDRANNSSSSSSSNNSNGNNFVGGNLVTGGNNPMWQGQMGDAGWGGSLHSSYRPGDSRVYSASAHSPTHVPAVVPRQSGSTCPAPACAVALDEAGAHAVLQGGPALSAKGMSDEALVGVMNGAS